MGQADFFVSYTSADRSWAEWIAWQLEAEDYQVVVQAWDFTPGRSWTHEMQQATSTAERVVAVLSAAYLQSEQAEAEWEVFQAKDPLGKRGLLLPVRVGPVDPPGLLKTRVYVDLVDQDAAGARGALLAAARRARGKPPTEPEFPGSGPGAPGAKQAPPFPGTGLRTFFSHLIQSHTQLFAGRDRETSQILDFVGNRGQGYIFIEAPSGYGKTSLLAHLVRDHPRFVYHFISQAYKGTDSHFDPTQVEAMLSSLCEQLDPGDLPSGDLRALQMRFRQLIFSPAREPTVIVLDAIDEVDQVPNYLLGLLPRRLLQGFVVILSARTQGERSYLSEVGLFPTDISLHMQLPGLDEDAVVQLLQLAGELGKTLAERADFISKLYTTSEGDPFYLRFLVEDVAHGKLTAENISETPSGLPQYLDDQLSQLNRSAHRSQHRDILGFILAAKGALSRADLIRLVPGLNGFNFDDIIREIHRFLLVHEDQYTFCHGRFKEYFARKVLSRKVL